MGGGAESEDDVSGRGDERKLTGPAFSNTSSCASWKYYREGGSDKHLRDIRRMLNVSGEQIDHAALAEWIEKRGLREQWQRVEA